MKRVVIGVIAAIVLILGLGVTPAVAATTNLEACLAIAQPIMNDPDLTPTKQPVQIQPGLDGSYVPVIMIHGWAGSDLQDGSHQDRSGAFSKRIDLTANKSGTTDTEWSLIGALQDIPGAAVFTFDYEKVATRWVTDSRIGAALGTAIDCLYKASGHKVVIVGHSMGGLAARYALTPPDGKSRADEVSTVVTFGTPNTGSVLAGIVNNSIASIGSPTAGSVALIRAVLAECEKLAPDGVKSGTICDSLPPPVRAFFGSAGKALISGSKELKALPPWPAQVDVHSLAGNAVVAVPSAGWFHLAWDTTDETIGDLLVMPDSAAGKSSGADSSEKVTCRYQMNPARGVADYVGLLWKVVAKNDVASVPTNAFSGTCMHANLMRSIELTSDALGYVNETVQKQLPTLETADLSSWVIGFGAVGPLKIGMGLLDAARMFEITDWKSTWFPDEYSIKCGTFHLSKSGAAAQIDVYTGTSVPSDGNTNIGLITIGEQQDAVSAASRLPRTAGGIGLGSSETQVRAAYGSSITTSPGWPGSYSHYLHITGPNSSAIEFDVDDSTSTVFQINVSGYYPGIKEQGCGD